MPHPRDRRRQFQARVTAPPITLTAQAREVLRLLEQTRDPVFVTGRAGTGKSTLLQYFRATTAKKLAVLAPTGVAAVQVRGRPFIVFLASAPISPSRKCNGSACVTPRCIGSSIPW